MIAFGRNESHYKILLFKINYHCILQHYSMEFTKLFLIRLLIYVTLLFTSGICYLTAQNATDSLVIQNDINKSTVLIVKKKAHKIRTPIIIVSSIIGIALILGTFVFLQYPGKS
jgi:hypothetical protein